MPAMWNVLDETWGGCGVDASDHVFRTGLGAPFPRGFLDILRYCFRTLCAGKRYRGREIKLYLR